MSPGRRSPGLAGRIASFRDAGRGVAGVVARETNARIHAVATGAVIVLASLLDLGRHDWALLLLAMGSVWAAEIANTAIESLADAVREEFDPKIGRAKDAAAGAVLVTACAAAGVGLLILGPPLWRRLSGFFA